MYKIPIRTARVSDTWARKPSLPPLCFNSAGQELHYEQVWPKTQGRLFPQIPVKGYDISEDGKTFLILLSSMLQKLYYILSVLGLSSST